VQMSINITDQRNIDLVLPVARKNNVAVMAKRPIADAAWRNDRPGMYKGYGQTYEDRLKQMRLNAKDFNLPWAELALRFTLTIEGVHTAIVGTTNPEHARANVEIANKGPLPREVVDRVRAANKAADPTGAWSGET